MLNASLKLLRRKGSFRSTKLLREISTAGVENQAKHANIVRLVEAYRKYGHLKARTDPLGLSNNEGLIEELSPEIYGINGENTSKIPTEGIVTMPNDIEEASLEQIIPHLQNTYTDNIGAEFDHLSSKEEREWFAHTLESVSTEHTLTPAQKRNIYSLLEKSEAFDHFMARKFGQFKRYGLEGAETMIPAIDTIFSQACSSGIEDVVIGMPHRGRLNFLVTLLDLPARYLFMKIKGKSLIPNNLGSDDVISHTARSVDLDYESGELHVSLLHNPSHLEAVSPVALGKTRAKQDGRRHENDGHPAEDKVLCLQIHGDAAFAGQGVVSETLLLSRLRNYRTGGSIHLIVNNQLGFTTTPVDQHSSVYNSDIAKFIHSPVLHVHGESPEAVVQACEIAVDYRNKFGKDIVVDLMAYRRWGHNEVDEPSFTNPVMYKYIRDRETIVTSYGEQLCEEGLLSLRKREQLRQKHSNHLEKELESVDTQQPSDSWFFTGKWKALHRGSDATQFVPTGLDIESLKKIGVASVTVPDYFNTHERLSRLHIEARKGQMETGKGIDWATAESLAIGTLMDEGSHVRLSGQDVERGTFSHRHACLIDQETEARYEPLNHMGAEGHFHVSVSPLAEESVLGYEYGYSLEDPNNLSIWEAQFGDFFNGAQIMVDTFVSSGETKWMRQSGLVILLPHGMDGTGPEHSSCRMERWLQLIDTTDINPTQETEKYPNMYIVNPTTPANFFHVLRRQIKTKFRKPLIVVAPKTLIRLPDCTSTLEDMAPGTHFEPVLPDTSIKPENVKKLAFVSGKLYYDLLKQRTERKREDIAIIRIEELSPFPMNLIEAEIQRYPSAESAVFCQEEHSNAGPWQHIRPRLQSLSTKHGLGELQYTGRKPLSAPAISIGEQHRKEHEHVTTAVFNLK